MFDFLYPATYGIFVGILMSVLLGAIFFILIQTGLKHHYKVAYWIAAGVITGDIVFVILSINFTEHIKVFIQNHHLIISILGGLVLIIIGLVNFFKKHKPSTDQAGLSNMKKVKDYYFKPLVINLLNPANVLWWLGLFATKPASEYTGSQKVIFSIAAVATVFWTEVGVAYSAQRLKRFTTEAFLKRFDRIVGLIFVFIGLSMLLRAVLKVI